ncbi:glucoamylase family protein [Collimonas pratensis]|nr:glucoamylase family protein [Collimonas pratensis]
MSRKMLSETAELDMLQRESFSYFMHETNPHNGLVIDKTAPDWPASIAAVGLALAAYPVAIERGFISRAAALKRVLLTLRFFWDSPQGPEPDATGHHGFYYHFLDMQSGRRAWQCELSTIDTTFFLAGALTAGCYFDGPGADEAECRRLAEALYQRTDWAWAQDGGGAVSMGWKPESGFLPNRWNGYDEALLLYVLGLGSPSYPLAPGSYGDWAAAYQWQQSYGIEYVYAGSLFTHQLSHIWVDFRGIQDKAMRAKGIDYFENSRRATLVQQQYAIENPHGFAGYNELCWGITASDGPGPAVLDVDGKRREFYDYVARGVPLGPDDGTIAPWVVVSSLPFAPEIVLPTIDYFIHQVGLKAGNPYGFKSTFNPSFPCNCANPYGWVSPWHFGIDQGPIILMIENYRSDMLWRLMRNCPYIVKGLQRAGFTGGWLPPG